jgi:hypothetical protein
MIGQMMMMMDDGEGPPTPPPPTNGLGSELGQDQLGAFVLGEENG